MAGRLDGKVALISGGARGQGAAHAELFASEGADVVIGDILDEDGQATAEKLTSNGGGRVRYVHLDVTDAEDWATAVKAAEGEFGKLDILVNNAGVGEFSPVADCTDREWNKIIGVNQTGVFYGLRAAIPALLRAGGGNIVNSSSVYGGVRGPHEAFAYGAAKAAQIAMTQSAAQTYARQNIRVNAIAPGIVDTPMLAADRLAFGDDAINDMIEAVPQGRAGSALEMAKSVLFLVSDDSSHITGHTLVVDGGMSV